MNSNQVVEIDGRRIRLEQKQLIGAGGEGAVFRASLGGQEVAVKVYHAPNFRRQEKLSAFFARRWQLPASRVAYPLQPAFDPASGAIAGFVMAFLGTKVEEIARLANKKQRTRDLLTTLDVARIFLDGAATLEVIHRNGLVVGDFSDQNVFYRDTAMLWIDVDAWQFAPYPCPVGTEDSLPPELYGVLLDEAPVFLPAHDWYAYAVHLFRSLLLAHPYGGTHPDLPSLRQRARHQLYVCNPAVIYPKIAYPPELLSDDLAHTFERIFAGGWRGTFPIATLERYIADLVPCATCDGYYPRSRSCCPLCQAQVILPLQQIRASSSGVRVKELLVTTGRIVWAGKADQTLWVIAYEGSIAALYCLSPDRALRRVELFPPIAGARYERCGQILLVNLPHGTAITCFDVSGPDPVERCQLQASLYAGSRRAPFRATQGQIYYVQGDALLSATLVAGEVQARIVRPVVDQQTWFTVDREAEVEHTALFGSFRVFGRPLFWLMRGRAGYDARLSPLDPGEVIRDLAVHFSPQGVLVRRHTQDQGTDYLRTDLVDYRGNPIYCSAKARRSEHPFPELHGQVYAHGVLLHATDGGIVQERVESGQFKTFAATEPYVRTGDVLKRYGSGLLVVQERRVVLVSLSS